MATLYVENFPDDLYQALRKRAKKNHTSIAAEVISLLKEDVPTTAELRRREGFFKFAEQMGRKNPVGPGPFPSAEEMVREDRDR
jgi:plasmid stability protein